MAFTLPLILCTALAVATATALTIDVTLRTRATVERDGSVFVRGTVRCSAQTQITIDGDVIEELNKSNVAEGTFTAVVFCDTTETQWDATVTPRTDVLFRPGSASVAVGAMGTDPETGLTTRIENLGLALQLTRSGR